MNRYPIINCHVHTFTEQNVPRNFLPLRLTTVFRNPVLRKTLGRLALRLTPRRHRDLVQRYIRFIETTYAKKQAHIFKVVKDQYPADTRFIVLPMNMAYMGAGSVPEPIEAQHSELLELAEENPNVLPFCAIDPRQEGIVDLATQWLTDLPFVGVKIYPNLGYHPHHPKLLEIYKIAERLDLPIMTHCSTGGVRYHKMSHKEAMDYGHPRHYKQILRAYSKLRICLAHFGGISEWKNYLAGHHKDDNGKDNWVWKIHQMITSGNYPNLYTDISYTMWASSPEETIHPLKVLLEHPHVRDHVLFGSDYYMIEREQRTERQISMNMRSILGPDLFKQIAYINSKAYLGSRTVIP